MGRLPDFIIPGFSRSGTSSMREMLDSHPDIFTPGNPDFDPENRDRTKNKPKFELDFFNEDKKWDRGIEWYSSLFESDAQLVGEKTPRYLLSSTALSRIASTIPHVKLIILMRNPIDRLFSQYHQFIRRDSPRKPKGIFSGRGEDSPPMQFEEFLETEDGHLSFEKGRYGHWLKTAFDIFPRNQIHLVFNEEMAAKTKKVMLEVFRFLGVKEIRPAIVKKRKRRGRIPMRDETRQKLAERYRSDSFDLLSLVDENEIVRKWME